jgi:hypothetical protein
MCGTGAEHLARAHNLRIVDQSYFITELRVNQLRMQQQAAVDGARTIVSFRENVVHC